MHRLAPIVNEYVIDDEDDDDSSILEDEIQDCNMDKQSGTHLSRSTQPRISTASSNMNTTSKRAKDISPCYVCGAKAHGYNFDQSKDLFSRSIRHLSENVKFPFQLPVNRAKHFFDEMHSSQW